MQPSHLIITSEKALSLIEKHLTPHEDKFMDLIEQNFPDVGQGCALMAACLFNQIKDWKEATVLKDQLFNFIIDYVANKEHHENPNPQELN